MSGRGKGGKGLGNRFTHYLTTTQQQEFLALLSSHVTSNGELLETCTRNKFALIRFVAKCRTVRDGEPCSDFERILNSVLREFPEYQALPTLNEVVLARGQVKRANFKKQRFVDMWYRACAVVTSTYSSDSEVALERSVACEKYIRKYEKYL